MNNHSVLKNLKRNTNSMCEQSEHIEFIGATRNTNASNKFNPDVETNLKKVELVRNNINYSYSNDVWKPIIGSINKTKITKSDMLIPIPKTNTKQVMANYEQSLMERENEKNLAKKMAKEYSEKHNKLNVSELAGASKVNGTQNVSVETNKPSETRNQDINNDFSELKQAANNILSNSNLNDIDLNELEKYNNKLENLLNAIKSS